MPCDVKALVEIGRRHNIPVIEDAACASGSEILWDGEWQKVGKPHADIACFSFHPRKVVTTGDGGMLTTANPDYDRLFRLWRQHAMSVTDAARHGSREVIFESYPDVGYNYRMTDMQAAIGREQLKRLPEIVEGRRKLAATYTRLLRQVQAVEPPAEPRWARSNWQSYCVMLPDWIDQKAVMQALLDQGISTRRGIMNIHREPAYDGTGMSRTASTLDRSERAQDKGIILPLYAQMTEADIVRVVEALAEAVRQFEPARAMAV
jgi:dTDP-4-amino-4,6-dideoxygalactose transaminase